HGFGIAMGRGGEVLLALGHETEEKPGVDQVGIERDRALQAGAGPARRSLQAFDENQIEKTGPVLGIERQAALELGARFAPLAFDEEREAAVQPLVKASSERSASRQEPGAALRAVAMIVEIGGLAAGTEHDGRLTVQPLEPVG